MSDIKTYNTMQARNFMLKIPDQNASTDFQWMITDISTPSIALSEVSVGRPKLANQRLPGSALMYGVIDIDFIVDVKLSAYKNLYIWMLSIMNPISNYQPKDPTFTGEKDALLHILNNQNSTMMATFKFYGLYPYSITPLSFSYSESGAIDAMGCTCSFGFSYMELLNDKMESLIPFEF